MSPGLRKLALTAHVVSSVAWIGAVTSFLVLAVAGLTSREAATVRAAYITMELIAWLVIVPLSLASPLTGLIQALGTPWGLFRHYWVLVKALMTIPSTIFLLLHMRPIGRLANKAAEQTLSFADFEGLRIQLAADSSAALLVLLVTTTLAIYKPRGLTRYGARKQQEQRALSPP
jgi:uncharacterized membrane protein